MTKYYQCDGIVKTNLSSTKKRSWEINAKNYDSATRTAKKYAQSNYRDSNKESTLFDAYGTVCGWTLRTDGKIVYLDKWDLENAKLIPKSRK